MQKEDHKTGDFCAWSERGRGGARAGRARA